MTSRSLGRTADDLEVARAAFYQSLDTRADAVAALTRLVTALPVFRAHLTDTRLSSDLATIDAMVDGYRGQLKAQFCIVTDVDGRWLASPGWAATDPHPTSVRTAIENASRGQARRGVVSIHDQLFLVVSEPARFAEEILGTMTVAYVLDDTVARDLAQITRCQVTLVSGTHLCATSLGDGERAELAARVASGSGSGRMPRRCPASSSWAVIATWAAPSRFRRSRVRRRNRLVLLQNWRPTQQFVDQLLRQFLGAAAIIFGFALAGGFLFSQRLSRPLREIAGAARDIAAGNLTRQLPVRGSAEATTVAVAFNDMSTSLRVARERLLHDAIHDLLTELPNRVLFMERLQRSIRRRYRHPEYTFAVLFVDLDRFKTINDSLGHAAGDRLLIEIARRLTDVLRRDDTVARTDTAALDRDADNTLARLGGDEFIILVEDIRDPSDAVRVAERIQTAVSRPVSLGDREVFITASVGIAIGSLAHRTGDDVVRDANLAMHRAKSSGGDRSTICDPTMHDRAVERLQLETDLRRAIERREFVLHYQPIVALRGQQVIGFEALVRWQHPERGLLSPAAFLEVAEETGIIARIDEWVLKEACSQASDWQRLFPSATPAGVSVNISAQGFGRPDLVNQVQDALRKTGLDPRSLRLEITETVAMADAERTRNILVELKALGVRLSLDDFGTGYSSLSYLQRFPVDTLKIDQSFVAGLDGNDECREIIRMILNLARWSSTSWPKAPRQLEQVDYLAGLDCRFGQGFFFSKAVPFQDLGIILAPVA